MAAIVLLSWPFIAMFICMRMGVAKGIIWGVAIGHLTLPEAYGFDLPGLPPFYKSHAIALGVLLALLFRKPTDDVVAKEDRRSGPEMVVNILAFLVIISPMLTVFTNTQPIVYIEKVKPGLGMSDVVAMAFDSLTLLVPFLVARRYLHSAEMHRELLRVLVACGIAYSFLVLFEVRMSPQLHRWTYGYFQHSWAQHLRGGDFRPIVFLEHGLWIGFLLFSTVVAGAALYRGESDPRVKSKYMLATIWLFCVLAVSKNFGALALALILVPIALFSARTIQIWVGVFATCLFLIYPAARQADILPIDRLLTTVENINVERAASLSYRLYYEELFMERALEKPLTGWGVWARWRIADEYGTDISTSDGKWISYLGERGWIGYIAFFGLFTVSLFYLGRINRKMRISMESAGLAIIIAGNLIYLLPNNTLSSYNMLISGALAGFVQTLRVKKEPQQAAQLNDKPRNRFTRFEPKTIQKTKKTT